MLRFASFHPGWALTFQAGAAFAIALALAAWQFSRALEKTTLRDERAERLQATPLADAALSAALPDFTRVSLTGVYDSTRHFLVAARQGQGFEVFTPLVAKEGVFLINRGWHSAAQGAGLAPAVETPAAPVTVVAVAWPLVRLSRLVAEERWPDGWPKRVRGAHVERMAAEVDARRREFRLERGGEGVFRAPSLAWDFAPGMHWGYVAQWLLIGAAVAGGYVLIGKRRGRKRAETSAAQTPEAD